MNNPSENRIVEVVAAVLQQPNGAFLLARRPPDKIWPGYWEFPGGKVEPDETLYQALARELNEELGITVETAYPWITRVFTYPHATVRLNFFRVTGWRGMPHPHEGQEFAWQSRSSLWQISSNPKGEIADRITVSPLLPANAPVLQALSLPMLYGISNVSELGTEEFMRRLQIAMDNGLQLVQLREKHLARGDLRRLAQRMLPVLHAHDAKLLLNGDIDLAREVGADGVQLTSVQLAELTERPAVEWCAASCHDVEELRRAESLGCDFVLLSPVLPTRSHPGSAHIGWEKFSVMVRGASIPVYALGGMSHTDLESAWQHGAHGIALLRQAWAESASG